MSGIRIDPLLGAEPCPRCGVLLSIDEAKFDYGCVRYPCGLLYCRWCAAPVDYVVGLFDERYRWVEVERAWQRCNRENGEVCVVPESEVCRAVTFTGITISDLVLTGKLDDGHLYRYYRLKPI